MVRHVGLRDYSCFLRDLHGFGPEDVSILTIPSEPQLGQPHAAGQVERVRPPEHTHPLAAEHHVSLIPHPAPACAVNSLLGLSGHAAEHQLSSLPTLPPLSSEL